MKKDFGKKKKNISRPVKDYLIFYNTFIRGYKTYTFLSNF